MLRGSRLVPVLAAALVGAATPAWAGGDDVATAQVLFDEGRRLMVQQDYAGACPKLEESQRLAPGVGTEFNLADCWEHVDKLASAWAAFLDVAEQTHRRGEAEREHAARERAASLEPRLAHMVIEVALAHRPPDLEILRDGQVVREALWGVGVPVDAGEHRVEAKAIGRRPWSTVVQATDGQATALSVPELPAAPVVDASASPPVAPVAPPPPLLPPSPSVLPPSLSPDRTAPLLVLGGSLALSGLGVVAVVEHNQTVSTYNADSSCPAFDAPTRSAHCDSLVSSANTWITVGVVAFVASGLALGGGVTLWLTAPHAPAKMGFRCLPGLASIACGGLF